MAEAPDKKPVRAEQRCPSCGTPGERGQLVCLTCGTRMALDYRRPYGWKLPVAIVTFVALLVGAGSAFAFMAIDDDASREARASVGDQAQTTTTRKPAKTTADKKADEQKTETTAEKKPETTAAEEPEPKDSEPQAPEPKSAGATWPDDKSGYTVVIGSTEDRSSATGFAREARQIDVPAGVIEADKFKGLGDGLWIVYAGQYDDRAEAEKAVERYSKRYPGAYPQTVSPR